MLLKAKYVVPVTAPFIEDGAVLVLDDSIADIGPAAELAAKYPDEQVKDLGLSALMPGFVDLHTHLSYSAMRGLFEDVSYVDWKRACLHCEPFMREQDWIDSARLGALEALASGITTVADIDQSAAGTIAAQESGLRAVIYREVSTMRAKQAEQVVSDAAQEIEDWQARVDTDRIKFGLAAGHVYACHPKVYRAIVDFVGDKDTPVAMHIAGTKEEADFVRYGSSPFSIHATEQSQGLELDLPPWLPAGSTPLRYVYNWELLDLDNVMVIHAVHVDDEDVDILQKCKVAVAFCPRINAKLGMGFAPIPEFLDHGITVGLGTDSPAAVDTIDMIDEMRMGLMLTRAAEGSKKSKCLMDSRKILEMATLGSAKALRLDDRIGSLDKGKKADIIAIDLHNSHQNPTSNPAGAVIHTANQDNVKMTMVAGQILYDDFTHVSGLNRDGIVENMRELRLRLRARMNDSEEFEKAVKRQSPDIHDRYRR